MCFRKDRRALATTWTGTGSKVKSSSTLFSFCKMCA
jgi:hypothetical protein